MKFVRRTLALTILFGVAACACTPKGTMESGQVTTNVGVVVTPDGAGNFTFKYDGRFADADGNFDFSQPGALGNVVTIEFKIDPSSVPGLKFKSPGTDAMWIVEKAAVGEGSPQGPYRGKQFTNFATSEDGLSLRVTDLNNDGVLYRYALRFDLNGATVQHDPDTQNGQGGGGGN